MYEHIGNDDLISELRMFAFVTRVDVVADVKPGPAIEPPGRTLLM